MMLPDPANVEREANMENRPDAGKRQDIIVGSYIASHSVTLVRKVRNESVQTSLSWDLFLGMVTVIIFLFRCVKVESRSMIHSLILIIQSRVFERETGQYVVGTRCVRITRYVPGTRDRAPSYRPCVSYIVARLSSTHPLELPPPRLLAAHQTHRMSHFFASR